ncbi:STAS domain-containing protein [Streptomyces sp. NPDC048507]|uniref:STAS domain-containing protein n=1 Tax=Streptomyces sp. NPDC048507 TaxID=3365560 RepID=UPI003724BA93
MGRKGGVLAMEPRVTVVSGEDGVCVIVCVGEFDMDSAGLLPEAAASAECLSGSLVVIDVSGVEFADSSFLSQLLHVNSSRRVVLRGPLPGQLARLLEMTGAQGLFEVRDAPAG